jgi:hypothetical protein
MTAIGTIQIVAALIRDGAGRVLLVRKRGTTAFMQPGGNAVPERMTLWRARSTRNLVAIWSAIQSGRSAPSIVGMRKGRGPAADFLHKPTRIRLQCPDSKTAHHGSPL